MKISFNKFSYFIILLYIITPIFVMIGNAFNIPNFLIWYFPNLLASIIGLYYIIINIKNYRNRDYFLIGIIFIISIISSLIASNPLKSFIGFNSCNDSMFTFIGYLGFFICTLKFTSKDDLLKLSKIFVFVSSFIAFLTLIRIPFISSRLFLIPKDSYYFYVGPFSFFNQFGAYLLYSFMINVFLLFTITNKKKIKYFITLCILTFTLVINDTFSVFLGMVLFLIIISFYCIKYTKYYKELLICIIIFLLSCLTASRDGYNVVKRNFDFLYNDICIVLNIKNNASFSQEYSYIEETIDDVDSVGSGRGELWSHGIKYILKKPIFGYGYENIIYEYKKDNINNPKPHNRFIEYAQNTGIICLFIYIYLIGKIIIINLIKNNNNNLKIFGIIFLITYLFNAIFSISFFNTVAYFYIVLGIVAKKTDSVDVNYEKTK